MHVQETQTMKGEADEGPNAESKENLYGEYRKTEQEITELDNTTSSQDNIEIWPGPKTAIPLFEQVLGNVYGNHKIFVGFQLFNVLEFNDFP